MDNLKKALDRFNDTFQDFLNSGSGFSAGYGLDPDRKGPNGIIVYAMHDDENFRSTLLRTAKSTLPASWETFPVYFKGTPVPWVPSKR